MPELPDVTVYVEALRARIVGARLIRATIRGPFLVRSVEPPIDALEGLAVSGVERLGKRVVIRMDANPELFLVIHLMIAGRLLWKRPGVRPAGRIDQAAFEFEPGERGVAGTLILTEASTQKRAALHVIAGREELEAHAPKGLDVFACAAQEFGAALRRDNRTLKRVLTDPRTVDGIGNAYSDEILHAAGLSPVKRTASLSEDEIARLLDACRRVLSEWTDRLLEEFGLTGGAPGKFPGAGEITAFRPDFAVHGKFRGPCPVCGTAVQRIVHAENETNYCPRCQTGGRLLADRSLSRLLKDDWPRTVEEWEGMR